jgi:hypothetical protein
MRAGARALMAAVAVALAAPALAAEEGTVRDCLIAEHRDVTQRVPETSVSEHGLF